MNVFMLRTFWIRSAHIRVNRRATDFRNALQSDHRYGGLDMHLQVRRVGNGTSPLPTRTLQRSSGVKNPAGAPGE